MENNKNVLLPIKWTGWVWRAPRLLWHQLRPLSWQRGGAGLGSPSGLTPQHGPCLPVWLAVASSQRGGLEETDFAHSFQEGSVSSLFQAAQLQARPGRCWAILGVWGKSSSLVQEDLRGSDAGKNPGAKTREEED